jgi:hypothetical protein
MAAQATATVPAFTPTAALATLTAALSQTVVAALPPTATAPADNPNPYFRGIDGASVRPLQVPSGQSPLWLVTSTGEPDHKQQPHFVAIYGREGDGWRELGRLNVPEADFFDPEAVRQVQIDARDVWLELEAGVGAHAGIYKILRWDGGALTVVAENTGANPVAGGLQDLDGDGAPEVILDRTEHYVFCYACGERYFNFAVLRWDAGAMREARIEPLAGDDEATKAVNLAVAQARAGLWKDAAATIAPLESRPQLAQPLRLAIGVLRLHADAFAQQVADGPYPLLDRLFYGDYASALEPLRALDQVQLFSPSSPLISDTVAAGWDASLTYWVTSTTTLLIDSPLAADDAARLARARFLRGWSLALVGNRDGAIADIERAVALAPDDRFFADSLATLKARPSGISRKS